MLVQMMMQMMNDGGVRDTFTQKSFHAIHKNHILHLNSITKANEKYFQICEKNSTYDLLNKIM
jgi:hypothetical protein